MQRDMITIDEALCTGCGQCVPNCPEGAIRMIDGKARVVSATLCDGLGACIGHCPEGAITIERTEAEPYDERTVMKSIVTQGQGTIAAHLEHLKSHGQTDLLNEALEYLREHNMDFGAETPGQRETGDVPVESAPSALSHWPIQLHLISPTAPQYERADVVLAADCTAFSYGGFHRDYLSGAALAIACPKLDSDQDAYREKIVALIDEAKINTLTVMIMQVPCCRGLLMTAMRAVEAAERKVPVKCVVVGVQGEILTEEWV